MIKEEYYKWVEYKDKLSERPFPAIFFNDYDNWKCRERLGKFLGFQDRKYEPAIILLEGVIDEVETLRDKVKIYYNLGIFYWRGYFNKDKSIEYLERALEIVYKKEVDINPRDECNIWFKKINILSISGNEKKALIESNEKILKINSSTLDPKERFYLHSAYRFKAHYKKSQGKLEDALNFLKISLEYYPLPNPEKNKPKIKEIWENRKKNLENAFNELDKYSHLLF